MAFEFDASDLRAGRVLLYPGEPRLWMLVEPDTLRDLERRMTVVQMGARVRVRRRTGRLLSTIRKNNGATKKGPYVDVIAGERGGRLRYTMIEHDGSRPHVIRPRRRKALRFLVDGRVVFRSKVNHPGTRGTKFLTASLPLAAR